MSSILSMLGAGFEAAGSSMNADEENAYNDRLKAYQKALARIEKENKKRSERVSRRNQLMGVIGSKNRFLDPQLEDLPSTPKAADYDVGNALSSFGGIVGGLSSAGGGMDEQKVAEDAAQIEADREARDKLREQRRSSSGSSINYNSGTTPYASGRGFTSSFLS